MKPEILFLDFVVKAAAVGLGLGWIISEVVQWM